MKRPITLAGFEATFRGNPDPWNTFAAPDEVRKRRTIVHAMGAARFGRVLEIASGNGSNTIALARRALRLDAVDGAPHAVALSAAATQGLRHVTIGELRLPGRFPHRRYDAIVAAEILYYLDAPALRGVAGEIGRTLRPGGRLILAHSHLRFADVAQSPADVHDALLVHLAATRRRTIRTDRWRVETFVCR